MALLADPQVVVGPACPTCGTTRWAFTVGATLGDQLLGQHEVLVTLRCDEAICVGCGRTVDLSGGPWLPDGMRWAPPCET